MLLVWTENARQERLSLIRHIAEDDVDVALRIDATLRSAAEKLLVFPEMAPAGRVQGPRDLFVKPRYSLIYKIVGEKIVILSVLHTSQLYPTRFDDL